MPGDTNNDVDGKLLDGGGCCTPPSVLLRLCKFFLYRALTPGDLVQSSIFLRSNIGPLSICIPLSNVAGQGLSNSDFVISSSSDDDVDESVSVDEDVVRSNKSLLLILDDVLLGDARGGEEEISGVSSPGGGGGGGASISFGFIVDGR